MSTNTQITFSSGAVLQFSEYSESWVVQSNITRDIVSVVDNPRIALLLLEEDPVRTIPLLSRFPFAAVIQAAQQTGLTRYQVQADCWQKALSDFLGEGPV